MSGRLRTPWVYQAYLEPQSATAWLDFDGTVVVQSATQGAFATRQGLAELLDLPLDRVRVRPTPLGGAFGGKLMLPEPLAAAAALLLKRPVRVAFTRMEDFAAANPAPAELLDVEAGASRDGRLEAIRARVVCDRGMNEEFGVESISSLLTAGPYRWGAHELRGYGVLTNRVGSGAYRGPGAPPAAFAVETLLDELAAALDIDPIELRLRNVYVEGDAGIDGTPFPPFGAKECLERLRDHPLWRGRADLPAGEGVGRRDRLLARRARAGGGDLPPRRRRQADDHHRRGRHERHRDDVRLDRRRGVRRRGRRRARRRRRHVEHAVRRAQRRQQGHLHGRPRGAARRRRGARAAARRSPRPSSRSPPRTSRSSTARCAPRARRAAGWRSPTSRRRS